MADWEDASADKLGESAGAADDALPAETPSAAEDSVAPTPAETFPTAAEPAATPASDEPRVVDEPPFLTPPAGSAAALGLTGELHALRESLGEPAGETSQMPTEALPEAGVGAEAQPVEAEPADADAEPAEPGAEGETSLDDIAPGTVASDSEEETSEAAEAEAELAVGPTTTVSWWPFVGYVVVWLGCAAYVVSQLRQIPTGQGVYETNLYSMSVLGGLSLLAAGPALLLIVWLASWIGRKNRRIGSMFISALVKGATATLLGAVIWIGALMLIDYLRFGRPY
jgi:hypothetical protein